MDSLDAQCLVMQLTDGTVPPPDLWRHDRSGALSWAYSGGENTYTWRPEQVADMARRWRRENANGEPAPVRKLADAHRRLLAMAGEVGLGPADVVVHDLTRAEIRGMWGEQKLVVVIEEIGERLEQRGSGEEAPR
jgi:hypothetical protein